MKTIQSVINEMLGGLSSDIIAKYLTKEDVSNQLLLNYSLDERIVCAIENIVSLNHSHELSVPVSEVLASGLPFEWDKITEELSEIFETTSPWDWQQEISSRLEKEITGDFVSLYYCVYLPLYDSDIFTLFKEILHSTENLNLYINLNKTLTSEAIKNTASMILHDVITEVKLILDKVLEPREINVATNENKYTLTYDPKSDFDIKLYNRIYSSPLLNDEWNNNVSYNSLRDASNKKVEKITYAEYLNNIVEEIMDKLFYSDSKKIVPFYFNIFFNTDSKKKKDISPFDSYCVVYDYFLGFFKKKIYVNTERFKAKQAELRKNKSYVTPQKFIDEFYASVIEAQKIIEKLNNAIDNKQSEIDKIRNTITSSNLTVDKEIKEEDHETVRINKLNKVINEEQDTVYEVRKILDEAQNALSDNKHLLESIKEDKQIADKEIDEFRRKTDIAQKAIDDSINRLGNRRKELVGDIQKHIIDSWNKLIEFLFPKDFTYLTEIKKSNSRLPSRNILFCEGLIDLLIIYYLSFNLSLHNGEIRMTSEVRILISECPEKYEEIIHQYNKSKERYNKIKGNENFRLSSDNNSFEKNADLNRAIEAITGCEEPDLDPKNKAQIKSAYGIANTYVLFGAIINAIARYILLFYPINAEEYLSRLLGKNANTKLVLEAYNNFYSAYESAGKTCPLKIVPIFK